ncbi:MAG: hypothetical protein LBP67_05680 [Bacteroidales bacterium]|jgi:hypothetical protein|nr:hypothetical protein [Bacteroidales bacterium]
MRVTVKVALILLLSVIAIGSIFAQQTNLDDETLKKANDPLAQSKAINLHNYIVNNVYGHSGVGQNMLMLRYGQPIGRFLIRGTLPLITSWAPGSSPRSGLGDFNLFGICTFDMNGIKVGFGPLITFPTGTNDLSSNKWQAGAAAMIFFSRNPILQSGALLQWQASFAGKKSVADVNMLTVQLFGILQLGKGTYLRSTGVWSFNFENQNYNIPLGLGIGKVVMVKKVVLNIFVEPQFSVLAKGEGQTRFQTFIGVNTQF